MYHLQKIDESLLPSYKYLTPEDECYFFMGYTPVWVGHTAENSIIMNFKKKMDKRGKGEWKWKEREIQSISNLFIQSVPPIISPQSILVPAPPSKMKGDPMYDDRLVQLVRNYCVSHPSTEFREIIGIKKNMTPTHEVEKSPDELMPLFTVDKSLCAQQKEQIVIVDDVLRHGAHFKAIKNLLQPEFPNSNIIGLFIARTVH
jgi:hypothetical protein